MRILYFALIPLAAPVFADTFVIRSEPSSAIVYLEGSKVTRKIAVDLPAGRHTVVLPDLPDTVEFLLPQISVTNATLGPVSVREDALHPLPDVDTDAVTEARAKVKQYEDDLANYFDAKARVMAAAEGAETQIEFLRALALNEGLNSDAETLGQIAVMIAEQTERARQSVLDAEKTIRGMSDTREELEKKVKAAQDELAALLTADEGRYQAAVTLSTGTASTAELTVSYFVEAGWQPQYDVSLETSEPAQLNIRRGATIYQNSGEDWTDINLQLSTLSLITDLNPSNLWPKKLSSVEPAPPPSLQRKQAASLAEPVVEAPVVMEETATPIYDGPGITYDVPARVTVANGVDGARIALDTVGFTATTFARAVPFRDETAFLMARFENATQEPFIEAYEVTFSVDNQLVGVSDMPEIAAGDEGVLAFGPIEDLRLERQVVNRNEADSGLINRSNVRDEEIRITVRNLGRDTYNLELLDRVPYSEQEELTITFTADPEPDEQDFDLKRGIMKWDLEMAPESEAVVLIDQTIRWPETKILR